MEYEKRVVAFIDVLGWSRAVSDFRISFARREQQAPRPLYVISGVPGSLSPLYVIGRVKATASRLRTRRRPVGKDPRHIHDRRYAYAGTCCTRRSSGHSAEFSPLGCLMLGQAVRFEPSCLTKRLAPAACTWSRRSRIQSGCVGRAPAPLSPPQITQ